MEMTRTVHLIKHRVKHDRISDATEIVGVVLQGWQQADRIVDTLNAQDPERPSWGSANYWKVEVDVLRLDDAGNIRSGD